MARQRPALTIETMVRDPDWLGDTQISPAQMAILKAIYGDPLTPEELDAYLEMTEGRKPRKGGYNQATLICGRRSGKTEKIAANVALYETITFDPSILAPGELGYFFLVAQNVDAAGAVRGYIEGKALLLESKGWDILDHGKAQERAITGKQIRFLKSAVVQCFPPTRASTRGKTGFGYVGDEIAQWHTDEGHYNPDVEVIRALRGTLATARRAKGVVITTPFGEDGVAYDHYQERATARRLFVHAPSWVMNPSIPKDYLEREREDDQEGFLREYGAHFGKGKGAYMHREDVERAMQGDRPAILVPRPATAYEAAIDTGFKRDRFVLGIAHRDGERVIVDLVRYWTPKKGAPLDDSEVSAEVAEHLRTYNCDTAIADKYGDVQLQNDLRKSDLRVQAEKQSLEEHNAMMKNLRSALRRGLLDLPNDPTIKADLMALRKIGKGNTVRIEAPRAKGFYDDISNVLAKLWMKLGPDASKADLAALNSGAVNDVVRLFRDRGLPVPEKYDDQQLPTNFMGRIF